MGKVAVGLTMSLDGFIAGPNDGPDRPLGEGGERLFEWYSGGDTKYEMPGTGMVFRISPQSVELLREVNERMGAFVTGRRTFDIANGWGGNPLLGVPTFVVTHSVPEEWAYEGSPYTFATDGVERAVELAKEAAGEMDVAVGAASIAQQCIRKGRAARRGTRQPGARPARRGRQVVRAPGHDADRPGEHACDRGPRRHAPHVPYREGAPTGLLSGYTTKGRGEGRGGAV
jgi:dihydrofolate reductase